MGRARPQKVLGGSLPDLVRGKNKIMDVEIGSRYEKPGRCSRRFCSIGWRLSFQKPGRCSAAGDSGQLGGDSHFSTTLIAHLFELQHCLLKFAHFSRPRLGLRGRRDNRGSAWCIGLLGRRRVFWSLGGWLRRWLRRCWCRRCRRSGRCLLCWSVLCRRRGRRLRDCMQGWQGLC